MGYKVFPEDAPGSEIEKHFFSLKTHAHPLTLGTLQAAQ